MGFLICPPRRRSIGGSRPTPRFRSVARALSGQIDHPYSVLAGLGPAIYEKPLVGPRAKPGEDELGCSNLNEFRSKSASRRKPGPILQVLGRGSVVPAFAGTRSSATIKRKRFSCGGAG